VTEDNPDREDLSRVLPSLNAFNTASGINVDYLDYLGKSGL
jgi:hypothetical protein